MENFFLGLVVGVVLLLWFINWMANRVMAQITTQHSQLTNSRMVVEAKLEEINGVYFLWSIKDNTFLAQGKDLDELKTHMDSRWKISDINIKILEGDNVAIKNLRSSKNT